MTDINKIFEQLKSLSLFELNRLRSAISIIMDDPEKNTAIKRHLKVGMTITYFCSDKNVLVDATIEEIRKTWASVINVSDGRKWNIKFYFINLQGINVNINPRQASGGLDRNSLKVGDRVGWHSKLGYELYGLVEKRNPKKALVRLNDGEQWTVSYSLLFLVMDGTSSHGGQLCIEGEVVR
ncbi:MAG: hypothetical protein NTW94_01890 [Legionellales bacterium]|nr:hypothetical protein [Legionellales bacterium]